MLRELLRLVETAEGPMSLTDLARQLGVDVTVIDGMLQHWVRKGRLVVEGAGEQGCRGAGGQGGRGVGEKSPLASPLLSPAPPLPCSPAPSGCGSCSGMTSCPFVARLPVTYRVNTIPLTAAGGPTATD